MIGLLAVGCASLLDDSVGEATGSFTAAPGYQLAAEKVTWIDGEGRIQSRWWDEHDEASPPEGEWLEVTGQGVECARDATHFECWGDPDKHEDGELTAAEGAYRRIAAGSWSVCAVDAGDHLACWGEIEPPAVTAGIADVAVGVYDEACLVSLDGGAECWGQSLSTTIGEAPDGEFTSISVGAYIACGLSSAGSATCWGQAAETVPDIRARYTVVSASVFHACGLRAEDHGIDCWGIPEWVALYGPPTGAFIEVGAGYARTCGLTAEHVPVCSDDP